MKSALFVAASVLALPACGPSAEAEATAAQAPAENTKLADVLAHERRVDGKARDDYRHPAETLAFFQVRPTDTVIEYAPGGGWYTRILIPYLSESGQYIASSFPPSSAEALGEEFVQRVADFGATFSEEVGAELGVSPEKLPFYFGDSIPQDVNGTVDRVLVFRMMHNLKRWGVADSEAQSWLAALKPGGLLGVVQHRAKADAPDDYVDGNRGYLKEADLIVFFESNGFELVEQSEINANPKDTADHASGVWALPPTYAEGDTDREQYTQIGESDRMTLLFKKPE
ncbi:MAG: methyltransferase [Pseudomonadota bacterium]